MQKIIFLNFFLFTIVLCNYVLNMTIKTKIIITLISLFVCVIVYRMWNFFRKIQNFRVGCSNYHKNAAVIFLCNCDSQYVHLCSVLCQLVSCNIANLYHSVLQISFASISKPSFKLQPRIEKAAENYLYIVDSKGFEYTYK